ncbi:carbohydrate deacetylase [Agromyces larvae]|uniref:ChbG/HpnK family deacetylase n=1 Tax=Agromyces larvae TaxID=2929802 RepID=A0ABY4BTT7_9MICO|nr:ChbG/HpnK family deacetylase [Agromyces larvae]UOE42555.1 ChbG/HpnK family deacetylase [Agromyces larvae]
MTRRLVLTADDLGRDEATSAAIAELAADGAITATTAIVVSPFARAAVDAVRTAGLEPRLHATLSSERGVPSWHPLTSGRSLGDADDASLPEDARQVGERAEPDEVAAELAAQLDQLRALGARPAAIDSHAGTLYGLTGRSFLPEALALCAREGLGLRLPRSLAPYLAAGGGHRTEVSAEVATAHAHAVAAADATGVPIPAAMITNRRRAVDLGDYRALLDDVRRMLGGLPAGTSELFLHPAPDGTLAGDAGAVRAWELRLLRDPALRAAIDAEGLELVASW